MKGAVIRTTLNPNELLLIPIELLENGSFSFTKSIKNTQILSNLSKQTEKKMKVITIISLLIALALVAYYDMIHGVNSQRELTDATFKSALAEPGAKFVKVSALLFLFHPIIFLSHFLRCCVILLFSLFCLIIILIIFSNCQTNSKYFVEIVNSSMHHGVDTARDLRKEF